MRMWSVVPLCLTSCRWCCNQGKDVQSGPGSSDTLAARSCVRLSFLPKVRHQENKGAALNLIER